MSRSCPPRTLARLAGWSFLVLLLAAPARAQEKAPGENDAEPEDVRPGLVASYGSLVDPAATVHAIDAKPAFSLGHSSPHPRLPAGPFEVTWQGMIQVREPGPFSFHAKLGGELAVAIDGTAVLEGRCESDTGHLEAKAVLDRPPGYYRLSVRFRSLAGVPARLQILWESPSFAREPLPAWRLGHLPGDDSPALKQDQIVARGREAAGRLGCARCHASGLPGVADPPPGPSLADASRRLRKGWLLRWLEDPSRVRSGARMPSLFSADRQGFVERWIIASALAGSEPGDRAGDSAQGNHRAGKIGFIGLGCAACHIVPDMPQTGPDDAERTRFEGLADRLSAVDLAAFLGNPHARYPDGRMPHFPISPAAARDIAAYLLFWSRASRDEPEATAPSAEEIRAAVRRAAAHDQATAAATLLREKGCASCHPGLGSSEPRDVPLANGHSPGCLSDRGVPHYTLEESTRGALATFLQVAAREKYASPFANHQARLQRAGCVRCHQRDSDRPPPIETIGSLLGTAFLQALPFQRTPRLTNPHQKFTGRYLLTTVRDGVSGLRPADYTYRMPSFGADAELLVQALGEADGELPSLAEPAPQHDDDPTLATLAGPSLVGPQGYGCISCHIWNGRQFAQPDPGAIGPDLTRMAGRIRRDWFDRFLEAPERFSPGTPMPAVFPHGKAATLTTVLEGNAARQQEALWSYFARGKDAPAPKPPPPVPVASPAQGEPALVAQIPIRLPDGTVVESICTLTDRHDLLIYDLAEFAPHSVYTGAQILRDVQSRVRRFLASGTPEAIRPDFGRLELEIEGQTQAPAGRQLRGYDRLADGVRIRWRAQFAAGAVDVAERLRVSRGEGENQLARELHFAAIPKGAVIRLELPLSSAQSGKTAPSDGIADRLTDRRRLSLWPDPQGSASVAFAQALPPARQAPRWASAQAGDPGRSEGSLERPGYRALAYPRPKTVSGEDRVMPAALAANPRDGRLFVASLKTGELFVLHDPEGNGRRAEFRNYTHGLFQDALSMRAEDEALYVLHRRNLTRIIDQDGDGEADRFDRVAALPHGIADTYDYGYGLVRDKTGAFLVSYAPYANTRLPGSGGVVRLSPDSAPREIAFGMRNPLGWCTGPGDEVFFTDNQGEWVAANKLCHLVEGRFYGFPNPAQREHADRPAGKAAVWVPYGWARSINGVAYDNTGGQFGPFAGQFFLAELMFGGALIRADLEQVNGQYQGACFPFWGRGLMGPVSLTFDSKGRLYVGGITEPGWMAQPDRGALFRIDYTGRVPFEIQSIRVRPRGFRLTFTAPVAKDSAARPGSYRVERYRYEFTGSYGSPELDRTAIAVQSAKLAPDSSAVELTLGPLLKDHVYLIGAPGIRSAQGEELVHPTGAYTLNEIPGDTP